MIVACGTNEREMAQLVKGRFRADVDPRELALYTPADASCYLGIHPQTLGTWLWGRTYPTAAGDRFFAPLIEPADIDNKLLSFFNLAELHVLAATRYNHNVSIKAVRAAMDTILEKYPSNHPLLSRDFKTNGKDLFVQRLDENENLSTPWQLNFKIIMDNFLEHVISDEHDLVKKIFPLIAGQPDDRIISITYGISSSQPVVDGAGVPVWLIHNRYMAGEPQDSIADDFDIPLSKIQRAIDYGRATYGNGTPALRIWPIGTNRMLGVTSGEFADDAEDPIVPRNMHFDPSQSAFGDFEVCPFTADKPGHMRMVCIQSAKNLVIK